MKKNSSVQPESVDALIKTIRIPPRPSLLIDVQNELASAEPSPKRLSAIIASDVALSASLLKLTNSSFFGLRLKARSVAHAVDLLGMEQSGLLMTGIIARQALGKTDAEVQKFWDFSSKRAQAMSALAKRTMLCSTDTAHTFGLFCNIGVPLLMERFTDYPATLLAANAEATERYTQIEDAFHMTNHAAIGSLMARTWGLPEEISLAILLHHDYEVLKDQATEERVRALVALALLAEWAIHTYHGEHDFLEWQKGQAAVCQFLGWSEDDIADQVDALHERFDQAA